MKEYLFRYWSFIPGFPEGYEGIAQMRDSFPMCPLKGDEFIFLAVYRMPQGIQGKPYEAG